MQAIRTRYYGPTNYTGSCIRAKCEAGSVRFSYDHSLNIYDNHKAACSKLREKLGWSNYPEMICGEFDGDHYHVFKEKSNGVH